MSCELFPVWVVSDDPHQLRQAEIHAGVCERCATILAGHERLREEVEVWRGQEERPENLEARIRSAIAECARGERPPTAALPTTASSTPGRPMLWWALAASFLLGIGLGILQIWVERPAPLETRRLLAATDLQILAAEERSHLEAIVRLERQAAPILARATDTSLASHRAGRLLEYRHRIASLDGTIDDVRGFVERNPGHPRARTMLLAAYREKKEILREVLALEERS